MPLLHRIGEAAAVAEHRRLLHELPRLRDQPDPRLAGADDFLLATQHAHARCGGEHPLTDQARDAEVGSGAQQQERRHARYEDTNPAPRGGPNDTGCVTADDEREKQGPAA